MQYISGELNPSFSISWSRCWSKSSCHSLSKREEISK